jgi:hypothetical protein
MIDEPPEEAARARKRKRNRMRNRNPSKDFASPWFSLVLLAPCEPLLELISHQLTYAAFLGGRGVASGASGSHGGSSNVFSV